MITSSQCTKLNIKCLYMVITYSKSMDQPGKVANPACGQMNKKNDHFVSCRPTHWTTDESHYSVVQWFGR